MTTTIFVLIVAFFASALSAIAGFGGALILIPMVSFFIDFKLAVGVLTFYFLANKIFQIYFYRRSIDWKTAGWVWLGAVPAVIVGALFLVSLPTELLKRLLGILILFYILNAVYKLINDFKPGKVSTPVIGAIYGFFSGVVGVGDPIKAALLLQLGLVKERFVATMAIIAILLNLIKAIVYSSFALVSADDVQLIIFLIIVSLLGTYLGKQFLNRLKPEVFKKIVLGLLLVVGLQLIFYP